jgi:hypothetical protein
MMMQTWCIPYGYCCDERVAFEQLLHPYYARLMTPDIKFRASVTFATQAMEDE